AIEKKHRSNLPSTWIASTGKGRHLYFRLPNFNGAPTICNSAKRLGAGLDVRGEGGYVVAPPSIHPTGRTYRWSEQSDVIAEAPLWLLALIDVPDLADLDARRPANFWVRYINEGVDEGARNQAMASIIGALLREEFDRKISEVNFA